MRCLSSWRGLGPACVIIAACGGGTAASTEGGGGDASTVASSTTGTSASASSGEVGASSTSTTGGAGGATTTSSTSAGAGGGAGGSPMGLATLGTLVVLGDSISDGGGQPPFYYELLKTDLTAKYGQIAYHNNAKSGSTTGALVGQINGLPGSLPGPVAVVITSGGNDMKANIAAILLGTDGPARTAMGQNVKAALDALLAPGRFGAGVDVHVYEGNIYDASDGAGDYSMYGCNFGKGLPATPTDGFFMNWNGEIATQVAARSQVVDDMHQDFYGHGYKSNPNWYASDCTHPSQVGHSELRKLFYQSITGEALP